MKRNRNTHNFIWVVMATVLLLLVSLPSSHAQTVTGSIVGTVKDAQGASMANASVTAKSLETGAERSTMTDAAGGYNIVSVPAGAYDVTVTAQGFQTEIQKGLTMTVGAVVRADLSLKVGSVSQQVEVTGEAPQINTSNATISGLVDDSSIRELPLNARDWLQLALTQSNVVNMGGAAGGGATGAGVKIFVAGARSTENVYRIDGFVVNDYGNNSPGNALGANMGVDAIREFTVLSSGFSAEYGRSVGGVINSILKSGTNELHGSGFGFLRNSRLDARNFFNPPTIPEFRRAQFGADVGGPIKKDKLFFFADYEGVRQFNPVNSSANTLSDDARKGLLVCDPTKIIDGTCALQTNGQYKKQYTVSPATAQYLPAFPEPTVPGLGDTGVFQASGGAPGIDNYVIGKVDYQMNVNNMLSVSYNYDLAHTDSPDSYEDKNSLTQSRTQRAILTFQHVFSPTIINTARGGVNRINSPVGVFTDPKNSAISDRTIGWIPGHTMGVLSVTSIGSFTPGGLDIATDNFAYTSPQASDDLSWVKGRNNIRIGGSFEDLNTNLEESNFPSGEFVFNNTANFIQGIAPSQTNIDIPGSNPARAYRGKVFGAYIVDDFRVLSNLTLNLGVRYEPDTVDKEAYGKASVIVNFNTDTPGCPVSPACPTAIPASPYRGNPIYQNNSFKNFAPRVGFAWDPFKDGKSSVRGAFGIYDILLTPNLFTLRLDRSFPYYNESIVSNPTCTPAPSCFPNGLLTNISPNTELTMYIQNKPPATYKEQWNLSIQRQLTPTMSLTLGYVGSRGVHLPVAENDLDYQTPNNVTFVNGHYTFPWQPTCAVSSASPATLASLGLTKAPVACGATGASFQPIPGLVNGVQVFKANPNWSRIQGMNFYGYASYNALQATLAKQMGHGLSFNASYTYSKSIDNGGQEYTSNEFPGSISNAWPFNTNLQRAVSDYDVPNSFALNFVYDIPSPHFDFAPANFVTSGWELSGIFSDRTGLPFSIAIPNDQAATGGFISPNVHVAQRPDFNPSAPGCNASTPEGAVTGNRDHWLNLACFPYPAPGTLGDLGRNQMRGPALQDFDFSIFKNTKFWREKINAQFRAEFFNILNHANFQAAYSVPYTYAAGTGSTTTGGTGALSGSATNAGFWFNNTTITASREIQFGLKVTF